MKDRKWALGAIVMAVAGIGLTQQQNSGSDASDEMVLDNVRWTVHGGLNDSPHPAGVVYSMSADAEDAPLVNTEVEREVVPDRFFYTVGTEPEFLYRITENNGVKLDYIEMPGEIIISAETSYNVDGMTVLVNARIFPVESNEGERNEAN